MKTNLIAIILFLIVINFYSCKTQQQKTIKNTYIFKDGATSGIGKWYLDREIAHVMGFEGINWLERTTREQEENTSKLIKNMQIKATDVIADIGAGSGYHVFKMAPIAFEGTVYGVDIQLEMLQAIRENKNYEENKNIKLIKGAIKHIALPENTIDKVLMVDVYHEFSYPKEMLNSIYKALKKNGEIYLIEYRLEDDAVPMKRLHKMSEKQAIKELKFAGFKLKKNINNLPWQHCMVFIKN